MANRSWAGSEQSEAKVTGGHEAIQTHILEQVVRVLITGKLPDDSFEATSEGISFPGVSMH